MEGHGEGPRGLADLVVAKETKFKGTVPLNEAVLAGQTSNVDYGGLIADVLDGLLMMTEGNWGEKREELAELPGARGGRDLNRRKRRKQRIRLCSLCFLLFRHNTAGRRP